MSKQAQMKALLERTGIAHKEIQCYGSQIVVTSHCADTANKWAQLLGKFAKVRGVIKSIDEAKIQNDPRVNTKYVDVWRTFAVIG